MSNENCDYGPGDLVTMNRGGGVWTVVGIQGEDLLLARGAVKVGGVWRPALYDMGVHFQGVRPLGR